MSPGSPELRAKSATLFTSRAIFRMCFWGLWLMVPVIISFLIVSVLSFGAVTFILPLVTIAVATFFLPLGFGNIYLARLFRPLRPAAESHEEVFLVQLTRQPRDRSGWLAVLEDADDIGFLSLTDSALLFDGDSIRLLAPYNQIQDLELKSAGWRALFAYGPWTAFSVTGLPGAGRFSFAERSSWHLPGSRRNARRLFEGLSQRVRAVSSSAAV